MALPPAPDNRGKRRKVNSIDGKTRHFLVEDEIVLRQRRVDRGSKKLIYFQKIRFEATNKIEYRLTYYMLGVKPGARGRWVFGQYSLMIAADDLAWLLQRARERKWKGI